VNQLWGLIINDAYMGIAGKTGLTDESVLISDPILFQCLSALSLTRVAGQKLWSFSMGELRQAFQRCSLHLNLGHLSSHPYCLRHGGASHDLLHQLRPLAEVQRRGRWLSTSSLRRYGKETRLLKEMHKVDPAISALGYQMESQFVSVVSGLTKLVIPSHAPKVSPKTPRRPPVRSALLKRPSHR